MKKFTLIALVLMGLSAKAQYFQHVYGSSGNELLSDGHNAYAGGNTGHFLVGPGDAWAGSTAFLLNVQRTNIDGRIIGPQTFNNGYYLTHIVNPPAMPANQYLTGVQSLEFINGNGFAIAGSYTSAGHLSIFYINMDPNGNIISSSEYVQSIPWITYADVHVTGITESLSNPGDLYITGYYTHANGQNRVFAIKIDQNGNLLWGSSYDMSASPMTDSDISYDILECSNFNARYNCYEVVVVGEHIDNTSATPNSDGFVLRLNSNTGVPTRQADFYGTANTKEYFTSVLQSANTIIDAGSIGFALSGITDMSNNSDDFWFMALDYNGAIIWDRTYDFNHPTGLVNNDRCYDIIERVNTGGTYEYYLAGYTDQGIFNANDILVIKTDDNGNFVPGGQFSYGQGGTERGIRIDQLNGFGPNTDGIAVYGYSSNNGLGGYDHHLLKAYFNGISSSDCDQDFRDPNHKKGTAQRVTPYTGELHRYFSANALLVDIYQTLQDMELCWSPDDPDGSNARVAPEEPKEQQTAIVSPNPMAAGTALATIELEAENSSTAEVTIYDMLGKQYYAGYFTLIKGKNQLPVDISSANMSAGMYTVKITGNTINNTVLFIVK